MAQSSPVAHPVAQSISEKIDPAEPPVVMPPKPLTDAERKRLDDLAAPKKMSPAETAELDALSRRADIPSPVVVHADDMELHGVLSDLMALVGALAAQVPTAHNLASQVHDLRGRLGRAMAASK